MSNNNQDNSQSSRERIINISEELFAEKGYDGARVDDIAKKAKVNKALIYYYFKSKEAILKEIMNRMIEKIAVSRPNFLRSILESESDLTELYIKETDRFIMEHINVFRIMFIELVKGKPNEVVIEFAYEIFKGSIDSTLEINRNNVDIDSGEISTIATLWGIVPSVFSVLLKDSIIGKMGVSFQDMEKHSRTAVSEFYLPWLKQRFHI